MKIKFSTRQRKEFIVEMPAVPSVGDVIFVSNMGGLYPEDAEFGSSEWIVESVTWYVEEDDDTGNVRLGGFVVGIRNEEEDCL